MDRFRRGVPDSKAYAQGFARKYRLADCDVIVEPFDAGPRDAAAYRAACLAVAGASDRPHLAFVITSEEQEGLQGDDSPYLVAKAALMGQGSRSRNCRSRRSAGATPPRPSTLLPCSATRSWAASRS